MNRHQPQPGASPSLFDPPTVPQQGTTRPSQPFTVPYKNEIAALQTIRAAADELRQAWTAEMAVEGWTPPPNVARAMAVLSAACANPISTRALMAPADNGTPTSRAAAIAVAPKARSARMTVLKTIVSSPAGLTDAMLERMLSMSHQSLSARRRELVLGGFVQDSGRTRKNPSGAPATVWVATSRGQAAAI